MEATFTFGIDLNIYMNQPGNLIPQLQQSTRTREIVEQEIVSFTASKKEADEVSKKRLVCVDKFDITVYGGPVEKDDNIFTKVIVNYPLARVTKIRINPRHKNAFYIESTNGVVGTVVTVSAKRAKEWRDSLKHLLPLKNGPEGAKQVMQDGKKVSGPRFLAWVNLILLVYDGGKGGKLVNAILLPDIVSVKATGLILEVKSTKGINKWDMLVEMEADMWESFIAQYLQEREEENERVRMLEELELEKSEALVTLEELMGMAGTVAEPEELEPEPEEEAGQDGISEGQPLDEWSKGRLAELEKELSKCEEELYLEEHFHEDVDERIKKAEKLATANGIKLQRVKDDIQHEKEKNGGGGGSVDPDAPMTMAQRMAMFNK